MSKQDRLAVISTSGSNVYMMWQCPTSADAPCPDPRPDVIPAGASNPGRVLALSGGQARRPDDCRTPSAGNPSAMVGLSMAGARVAWSHNLEPPELAAHVSNQPVSIATRGAAHYVLLDSPRSSIPKRPCLRRRNRVAAKGVEVGEFGREFRGDRGRRDHRADRMPAGRLPSARYRAPRPVERPISPVR
jgi:hypothetical protein